MKKIFCFIFFCTGLLTLATAQTQPATTAQPAIAPAETPAEAPADLPADDLAVFAGTYRFNGEFQQCIVRIKNGELWAEVDSYGENKLIKQATGDIFKSTSSYGTVFTFERDPETKAVKSVKLELMGMSILGGKQL